MSTFWSTTDPQMTRKTTYSHCMTSIAISPYNQWDFSLYKKTKVARQACFKDYQDDLHTLEYDLEDNLYPWKMTCIAIFVHKQWVSEELSCPRNHDLHGHAMAIGRLLGHMRVSNGSKGAHDLGSILTNVVTAPLRYIWNVCVELKFND